MLTITTAELVAAVNKQCAGSYYMKLVGATRRWVTEAVNVGIDSHLQACSVSERGDSYRDNGHQLECEVSGESLAVLLRRLTEMEAADTDGDTPDNFAAEILDSLGFEGASMEYTLETNP